MRLRIPGRARHVACVFAGAAALALASSPHLAPGADRSAALAHALEARGLVAAAEDVGWIDRPSALLGGSVRAVVRASATAGEASDLYLVVTRLSPEGVLLAVGDVYNLTETSGADESRPLLRDGLIAYISRPALAEAAPTVHLVDLAGQPAVGADWTKLERAQNAVTNLQQVGQLKGVERRTFAVEMPEPAAGAEPKGAAEAAPDKDTAAPRESKGFERDVVIELGESALIVRSAGRVAPIALRGKTALPPWMRQESSEVAKPSNLIQWGVDRVRAVPWIGDDRVQTIKAVAFTALDFVLRNKESVTGDTGEAGIAKDLGKSELDPPMRAMPVDPEIGWPPAPLEPWVIPALPGEGQWNPQDKDPFVRVNEGLPPAFLTTFVRSDRERKATRVYIALWDPRQVELHMMAGTVEPKGATGEAGPGLIPRTPEVLRRVVAASNAGFQAMHGEFGMMADGRVYLPPKPYAATVAVLRDGSTAFGSWPADTSIPESILSYRQNMTVIVQDEKWNPYKRTWWGGTPPGWADKTHTVRTGICLTKERFVGYFYGADVSPEALAQAMIQTRCAYGIALDMNSGHSGLEFYKIAPKEELEPLGRVPQGDWEAEGEVPGLDGWNFRARRLIRGMGLMHFPRYIKREGRDYFYMTLRHVLPGPALSPVIQPPRAGEGEWRLKGLPQHGFPYALALSELRPEATLPALEVRVLKIDPRTVSAAAGSAKAPVVAMIDAGPQKSGAEALHLWHSANAFSIAATPPVPEAVRVASGLTGAQTATSAIGVNDEDGMLVYVEVKASQGPRPAPPAPPGSASPSASAASPEPDRGTAEGARHLDALLKKLGCSTRMLLQGALPVALGGDTDLAGAAMHPPSGPNVVRLVRAEAAGAKRIFEDTPIVPFQTWYALQAQRIRYFKKAETAPAAGDNN
jgi:hypothetical protein